MSSTVDTVRSRRRRSFGGRRRETTEASRQVHVTSQADMCPACGTLPDRPLRSLAIRNARGRTDWQRCRHCSAWFMHGEYDASSEAAHTQTMAWGREDDGRTLNSFKQRMFDAVLDRIEEHAPAGASLLDVGCSFGGFLFQARDRGFDVRGVDIVPQAVQHLRSRGIPAEECSSLDELAADEPDTLDVVTVLDANIYWPDQPNELRGAWRMLRPGGLLVMRVIDKSAFVSLGAVMSRYAPDTSTRILSRAVNDHRFSMPLRSMIRVVRKCGFEVLSATPRGAVHSDQTHPFVKLLFHFGALTWHTCGLSLAPGAIIVARKPQP